MLGTLGTMKYYRQIEPNQRYDRTISWQKCDEKRYSTAMVFCDDDGFREDFWSDLETDYPDFENVSKEKRGNRRRHTCPLCVLQCSKLRKVDCERNELRLKMKEKCQKMVLEKVEKILFRMTQNCDLKLKSNLRIPSWLWELSSGSILSDFYDKYFLTRGQLCFCFAFAIDALKNAKTSGT